MTLVKGKQYAVTPVAQPARAEVRRQVLDRIRERWKTSLQEMTPADPGARCRRLLLPVIDRWLDRRFGRVNYSLTQWFTGHGAYNSFLARIGRRDGPECPYCRESPEDATHVVVTCPAWTAYRSTIDLHDVGPLEAERRLVNTALASRNDWSRVVELISTIITLREADGREEEQRLEAARAAVLGGAV
ncbi:uncharacterized protein LOC113561855 [Ooceraea biroi]|uniref:uncharacterized protein LOC113561855 n=1 Tax=Ooceraea biroi TaxID=2015173 RepID=UPI000F081A8C|nr:uncharacterized protein LOC113561855 [Ooceraea biroi]